jgi:nitroimidazol reductase NimA-like FMN-containing flavoprotein (pyridoxamine 5'-phosphate oxidase superfamily)
MTKRQPVDERTIASTDAPLIPWDRAREQLEEDASFDPHLRTHWLATVHPDGRPHVMPVWAIWVNDAFYFTTGPTTRKGKNLAHNSQCVITVARSAPGGLDLIVEGTATKVSDEARLQQIAEAYASVGWYPTVRDGAFYADHGAPSAGPFPFDVYEVLPTTVFGLGSSATRWSFSPTAPEHGQA